MSAIPADLDEYTSGGGNFLNGQNNVNASSYPGGYSEDAKFFRGKIGVYKGGCPLSVGAIFLGRDKTTLLKPTVIFFLDSL